MCFCHKSETSKNENVIEWGLSVFLRFTYSVIINLNVEKNSFTEK